VYNIPRLLYKIFLIKAKESKKLDFMNDITVQSKSKTYLFLETNNMEYMLNSKNILEIIKIPSLECPKVLPKHVCGLLEYKNEIINVMDLRSLLGLEIKPFSLNSKIIIISFKDNKFALVVDNVSDIKKIDSDLIKDAPYNSEFEIIQKIYTPKNDASVMVLNIKVIFEILKKSLENQNFAQNDVDLMPKDANSTEILKQRALNMKQKEDFKTYAPISTENQYITFKIDEITYCIKNNHIKEFYKINKSKITKIPSTPNFIAGVINVRGDFICVVDIKAYFNRGNSKINEKSTIIILQSDKFKIAILTEGIGESTIFENVALNQEDFVNYVQNEKIYCILNIDNILNNEKIYIK